MSEVNPSITRDAQDKIVERLEGSAAFAAAETPIFSRLTGDLVNTIDQALANLGIAILVLPPIPVEGSPNLPGPTFGKLEIGVNIMEDPMTNQSNVNAYFAAEEVLRRLHNWSPGLPNVGRLFIDPRPVRDSSRESILFECVFKCTGTFMLGD